MKDWYVMLFVLLLFNTCLSAQVAIAPAVGTGSEDDPYEISTLENLYWVAASDDIVMVPSRAVRWSSHYIQTSDINAHDTENWFDGDGWEPIGYWAHVHFTGTYDGQNYFIYGLYINRHSLRGTGLFGITEGATIKNLGVINVDIRGGEDTGILVGHNSNNSLIDNCYSTGSVIGTYGVGGLVGLNYGNSTIQNSYSSAIVNGFSYLGVLTGYNIFSTINASHSTGDISGTGVIGGLVGANDIGGLISASYSTANVNGSGGIGGLVGVMNLSSISNCYSRGDVTGGDGSAGGLVGFGDWPSISSSYSSGSVSGSGFTGGLIGYVFSFPTIDNCYWDIETSGQTASAGGEGRTTGEMTYPYAANTYEEWNFIEIWSDDENHDVNDGYPYLQEYTVSVEEEDILIPTVQTEVSLYPNPFNPNVTIIMTLNQEAIDHPVSVRIYNLRGQLVATLLKDHFILSPELTLYWNGKDDNGQGVASGIYFVKLTTGNEIITRKMTLVK